jgi:hypothetical protein
LIAESSLPMFTARVGSMLTLDDTVKVMSPLRSAEVT